jgi:hypothetical protein
MLLKEMLSSKGNTAAWKGLIVPAPKTVNIEH